MKPSAIRPLPKPPAGFGYYRAEEICRDPDLFAYQHLLRTAFDQMGLSTVITLNGVPTVYVRDCPEPLGPQEAAALHLDFWNQGVATVLLVRDPERCRVFSSLARPIDPEKATEELLNDRLVQSIDMATQVIWAENFYQALANGTYYSRDESVALFDPAEGVDSYLINNLAAVRDVITSGRNALSAEIAHAFLGRILFVSYLCHRGILKLNNYLPGGPWKDLRDFLACTPAEKAHRIVYRNLFPALRKRFNGSMFDGDLETEKQSVLPGHWQIIQQFLDGSQVASGQKSLGFWAYRFDFIPVETISSIYEMFFQGEDSHAKRKEGAFYTPRLLAETTLDLVLRERNSLADLRMIDPSCGSGIFLVIIFNRLVAEWNSMRRRKPSVLERANAFRRILGRLRGIDRNPTACRIACFSLYIAYLDQFTPADVDEYIETTGKMLPSILHSPSVAEPDLPVVFHSDFFDLADSFAGEFDIVVGNPPWEGRGSKQAANAFMEKAPDLLAKGGRAALILPSKIFLNPTSEAFQRKWLSTVTLDTLVQLADYRFILFKEAKCPSCIAVLSQGPAPKSHRIEYITPKVSLAEVRDGLIPISPQDRKWIRVSDLLANELGQPPGVVWKTHLWATPRDRKLLDYLFTLPRLSDLTHRLSDGDNVERKRWITGQGCKPWRVDESRTPDRELRAFGDWKGDDLFLSPSNIPQSPVLLDISCIRLEDHFVSKGYSQTHLYSKPPEQLFTAPLVVLNQGFTKAVFSDFPIRFQDSLQSFTNPHGGDEKELLFLGLFLNSKLARYFAFQTSANLGTERDKVHLEEVLRLPFFLPDHECAHPDASGILDEIAELSRKHKRICLDKARRLEKAVRNEELNLKDWFPEDSKSKSLLASRWTKEAEADAAELRKAVEPLIYRYFGLGDQDIALVEDTCEIFDKGDTPPTLESARNAPLARTFVAASDLGPYAEMICATLNGWSSGTTKVVARMAFHSPTGMALVELGQSKSPKAAEVMPDSGRVIEAAHRLQKASRTRVGRMEFHRSGWYFDGDRILIVKPARLGEWTRTSALNDAAALYAHIVTSRRRAKA